MIEFLLWLFGVYVVGVLVVAAWGSIVSFAGMPVGWREIAEYALKWPAVLFYALKR